MANRNEEDFGTLVAPCSPSSRSSSSEQEEPPAPTTTPDVTNSLTLVLKERLRKEVEVAIIGKQNLVVAQNAMDLWPNGYASF